MAHAAADSGVHVSEANSLQTKHLVTATFHVSVSSAEGRVSGVSNQVEVTPVISHVHA